MATYMDDDLRLLQQRVMQDDPDALLREGRFRSENRDRGVVGERSRTVYGGRETENAPRITQGGIYDEARGAGFSQRGSNILAGHMDASGRQDGAPLASGPANPQREQGAFLDYNRFDPQRGRATADVLAQTAAAEPDRNFQQAMLAQRRMDEMRGEVVGGRLTREEARRRFTERQGREDMNWNRDENRGLQQRLMMEREGGLTQRATLEAAARENVASTEAAAQTGVARIGADVNLQELAQQGRLADLNREGMGFQSGPGGESVFVGPQGDVTAPQQSPQQRALTFVAQLNQDLASGNITQEQFEEEIQRRARQDSSLAGILDMFMNGAAAGGRGAAGAGGARGELPTVSSQAEFDRLPSGAQFRDPNGTVRRKP